MSGAHLAFFALSGIILASALGVVLTRNVMHAVLLQLLALVAVGGVYILLQAEFVALVQILIYAGAVTTMLLFALMLTNARGSSRTLDHAGRFPALLAAGAFGALLLAVLLPAAWTIVPPGTPRKLTADIGRILFGAYALPFELVSVILLAALVGAVVLATKD
jgi:NADH:ubiquinone oxidoreductase subunit 6 (subunit J)